jgi:two-component system response regulator (stage 0 sporulation protein A)
MRRLMIADPAEETRQLLADAFSGECAVAVCSDGEEALRLLQAFCPDILVLDLMLPKVDGLGVLQKLRQLEFKTMVLAQIGVNSSFVQDQLHRLQVDYALTKPCSVDALKGRVRDFLEQLQDVPIQIQQEDRVVSQVLLQMGFAPKLGGYVYLVDAIPLYAQDPSQAITKELYVAVGQLYGKAGSLVERSIRNAIDQAWQKGNPAVWRQYFPCGPDGTVPRPSNGSFITRLAQLCAFSMAKNA